VNGSVEKEIGGTVYSFERQNSTFQEKKQKEKGRVTRG